jgi:hypothetical protein
MILIILLFFALATYIVFRVGDLYFNNIKKDPREKYEEKKWKKRLEKIQTNNND